MKSGPAIAFDVTPSQCVVRVLASLGVVAVTVPRLTGLPAAMLWTGLLIVAILVVLIRHRKAGRRRVVWHDDGRWSVADPASNEVSDASLAGWNRLGHWISLRLRFASGRTLDLLLLPDNVDADTRRRLVVRLQRGDASTADAAVSLLP